MVFLILIFAHLLADYPLQGAFLASEKGNNFLILISHAGIWTGCIATAGYLVGLQVGLTDIALLFFVHMIADYMKATNRLWYRNLNPLRGGLLTDQLIHVGQIVLFLSTAPLHFNF